MVQNSELLAGKVPVVATFIVKNELAADFEAAVNQIIGPTREEPGCLYYACTKAVEQQDPDHTKYVFVEIYKDQEALQNHLARPDIAAAIANSASFLKEGTEPAITVLNLVI